MVTQLDWPDSMVCWRSRRGILELDLILMPFYDAIYESLDCEEKRLHQWLLAQSDVNLQQWLLRRKALDALTCDQRAWVLRVMRHATHSS